MTKKRFAELELALLHLKQNVEIPEARLAVHPAIRKAVSQVGTLPHLSPRGGGPLVRG